ncbi:PTS ascorbate transporter subunit IIB [Leifsonia sp. Root227]|jgi:PTS system ascorbate-specific IIB component|uniref:PTS sugar transporter subunit IIB n=1 Tax=unclassified Leifsonia TaxID=2663824 RepID=UPI000700FCB7|nr:PTS sugar transporter subunit IIB [Leifsonia sp. Root227]KRC52196.1 PTS ascorbate transporter subunit IIB [Leifsonia sp. Root227]
MKIVAICGAGIGTSGILKVNAERVLKRLDIDADVTASDLASLATAASNAQVILTSPELVDKIGQTNADIVVVDNYFDLDELEQKLDEALG